MVHFLNITLAIDNVPRAQRSLCEALLYITPLMEIEIFCLKLPKIKLSFSTITVILGWFLAYIMNVFNMKYAFIKLLV